MDFLRFDALEKIYEDTLFSYYKRIYCYGCRKQYNMFPGIDDEDFYNSHERVDADMDFIYWKCLLKK